MTKATLDITDRDLREAFQRSGLWRRGWTYPSAMACAAVRKALQSTVRAWRRHAEKTGNPPPDQLGLL